MQGLLGSTPRPLPRSPWLSEGDVAGGQRLTDGRVSSRPPGDEGGTMQHIVTKAEFIPLAGLPFILRCVLPAFLS